MSALRRAALGTAALAVAFLPLLAAAPANAEPANLGACPNHRFCLWRNINFNNGIAIFDGTDRDLSDNRYNTGHKVDNTAGSMANNTKHQIYLWSGTPGDRCSGPLYIAQPWSSDESFRFNGNEDQISCVVFK